MEVQLLQDHVEFLAVVLTASFGVAVKVQEDHFASVGVRVGVGIGVDLRIANVTEKVVIN